MKFNKTLFIICLIIAIALTSFIIYQLMFSMDPVSASNLTSSNSVNHVANQATVARDVGNVTSNYTTSSGVNETFPSSTEVAHDSGSIATAAVADTFLGFTVVAAIYSWLVYMECLPVPCSVPTPTIDLVEAGAGEVLNNQ